MSDNLRHDIAHIGAKLGGSSIPVPTFKYSGSQNSSQSSLGRARTKERQQILTSRTAVRDGVPLIPSQDAARDPQYHVSPGREKASQAKHGFIAYFKSGEGKEIEMESITPSVYDLTYGTKGFIDMDSHWKSKGFNEPPDFKWVHLPANNTDWAWYPPQGDNAWLLKKDVNASRMRDQILRPEYWAHQQSKGAPKLVQSRFMKPFCRKFLTDPKSEKKRSAHKNLVFFMPYLHWEITKGYKAMRDCIRDQNVDRADASGGVSATLLREYLSGQNPVHIRRTLDQSYYSTLEDTSLRDMDQVVQRYTLKEFEKKTKSGSLSSDATSKVEAISKALDDSPMLMVDQCWVWLLGGDTVLSCFPQQWSETATVSDPTDIHASIVSFLSKAPKNRNKINTAKRLIYFIIDRCASNVLDENTIQEEHLHFLHIFDNSIDQLMEKQSQSLKQLWRDVKKSAEGDVDEAMFNVTPDFEILEDIKDIIEELLMISHVVDQQTKALNSLYNEKENPSEEQMWQVPRSPSPSHRGSPSIHGRTHGRTQSAGAIEDTILKGLFENEGMDRPVTPGPQNFTEVTTLRAPKRRRVDDTTTAASNPVEHSTSKISAKSFEHLELVERAMDREEDLGMLIKKAQNTYTALIDLLDLKQRQANLSEARSAGKSAREMENQSNSIMLFTVVTILFLPLSSIASIFGMNAKDFNQGEVTLRREFTYLFPISAFVVVVTFVLAFNTNLRRVLLLWLEILGTSISMSIPTSPSEKYVKSLTATATQRKERVKRSRNTGKEELVAKSADQSQTKSDLEAGSSQGTTPVR